MESINSTIRRFQNDIVSYINQSNLPVEVKSLVMKNICLQLETEADRAVVTEQHLQQKEASENDDTEVEQ